MNRITQSFLDARLKLINTLRKKPIAPYTKREQKGDKGSIGTYFDPNPGCWHFDHAYGGISLHEMAQGGGVNVIKHGYCTKREMSTFLDGVRAQLTNK